MNISIYMPVWLIQIFLWGCVSCSFLGLLLLGGGFVKTLIKQRHFYWLAIGMLTIRQNRTKEWTYGMFSKLERELLDENPVLHKQVAKIFNPDKPEITDITT